MRSSRNGDQRFIISGGVVLCYKCNEARLVPIRNKLVKSIVDNRLINPMGSRFLLDQGELLKVYYRGERYYPVVNPISISKGAFLLTNHRVVFIQDNFAPALQGIPYVDGSFELKLPAISGTIVGDVPGQSTYKSLTLQMYVGTTAYVINLFGTEISSDPIDVLNTAILALRNLRISGLRDAAEKQRV